MSIPLAVDGETDLDSTFFNSIIQNVNTVPLPSIEGALGAYGASREGVVRAADVGVFPGECYQKMQDALDGLGRGKALLLAPGEYINEVPDTPWVWPAQTKIISEVNENSFDSAQGGVILSGGPNRTADLVISEFIDGDIGAPPYIWAHGNQMIGIDLRAGATPISGSGLRWCPGEGSGLWNVGAQGFPEGGIEFQGYMAQGRLYNVRTFYNRSGLWFNGSDEHGTIQGSCDVYGLSGDNNKWMIDVDNGDETNPNESGGSLIVNVFGLKAEVGTDISQPYHSPAGHNPLVRFWNPNGSQVNLFGPWATNVAAATNGESNVTLVKFYQNDDTDAKSGVCTIHGGIINNYHRLLHDEITGDSYEWFSVDDWGTWRRLANLTHRGMTMHHSQAGDPLHGFQVRGNDPAIYLRNPTDDTTIPIMTGQGTPEGAVTAPVGSLYLRTDGGSNTTLYVKQSGTGNTGWGAK